MEQKTRQLLNQAYKAVKHRTQAVSGISLLIEEKSTLVSALISGNPRTSKLQDKMHKQSE